MRASTTGRAQAATSKQVASYAQQVVLTKKRMAQGVAGSTVLTGYGQLQGVKQKDTDEAGMVGPGGPEYGMGTLPWE